MFGYHLQADEIEEEKKKGLPVIQFFYKSPINLRARGTASPELFSGYKGKIFTHGTYVMNLGHNMSDKKIEALAENLQDDLNYLKLVGGVGTVIHYHMNEGVAAANIRRLLRLIKGKIILENVKGTQLGELVNLQRKFRGKIGFCFDTCHLFISGYDLRDEKLCKDLFTMIRKEFPDLALIHLNDAASMTKDEHALPGEGYIWNPKLGGNPKTLPLIMKLLKGIPMVHE